jgi:hypothetical protein
LRHETLRTAGRWRSDVAGAILALANSSLHGSNELI